MLESPLLGAAAAATSSKEPPQCLADSDGTGATQVLVVDHYDLRVERVQGFRQELLRQASEMLLFRSVNVYTHVNKHIYRCKKQNRSLGCSEGDVTIPPRPDMQLLLQSAEEVQQITSLGDISRLSQVLPQDTCAHTSTGARYSFLKQKRQPKPK